MEGDKNLPGASNTGEVISIHTLRMEGDRPKCREHFGGARISIHTLRMEGDQSCWKRLRRGLNFNPHPPHGG